MRETIRRFIDNVFDPVLTFIQLAKEKLNDISLITRQGLNVGKYLSVFGDMPNSWQLVISSALISVSFIGGLLIFRSLARLYFSIKEGVKWW